MICLVALIVFGILGIFSASHRKIAAEAFNCVFRQATLRKCNSGMDVRIKSSVVGKLMKVSPKGAKIVHKNFELFSWIFTLLLIISLAWSGVSIYNLIVYDDCNGPNADPGSCILTSENDQKDIVDCSDPSCSLGNCTECENGCNCTNCK